MLLWTIAIAVTALTCAALYYASLRRGVNARDDDPDAARTEHQRHRLAEIEEALAQQRLAAAEATAAKGELAREVLRQQHESVAGVPDRNAGRAAMVLPFSLIAIALVAFGTYGLLGSPDVQGMPLDTRPEIVAQREVDTLIAGIEQQLAENPDDLRRWIAIALVYVRLGRYEDAVRAQRRINALQPPTADTQTDLAEALVLANGGALTPEARSLLEGAAAGDPRHARSRFYLAAETLRLGQYAEAQQQWQEVLNLGTGSEPWYDMARNGLVAAQEGLRRESASSVLALPDSEQSELIRGMVDGLSERLLREGGSLDEWERLVRSRLVLGQADLAQEAYAAARAAYPDAHARADLDALARQGGLN